MISFYQVDNYYLIKNKRIISKWLSECIRNEGYQTGQLAIYQCSDEALLQINREHLNHDYYTDIITFDYGEGELCSGELYISIDRIRENAITVGCNFRAELHRVLVHGILHLCGYKDKSAVQEKAMRSREDHYLAFRPVEIM